MEKNRAIEGIIFDLGGTLIYYDPPDSELTTAMDRALFLALEQAGLRLDRDLFLQNFRSQIDDYYRERNTEFIEYSTLYVVRTLLAGWGYPAVRDEILKPALKKMFAITQAYWKPEAETIATLGTLQKQGYRLGLISNATDADDILTLVDNAGLRPFLDPVLVSAAVGVRKPNPAIFHKVLHHWCAHPGNAVMVGDTLGADILGARNAGMVSVWITRRADTPANRAHGDTIRPDAVIENLGELPGLLERMG